MLVLDLDLSSRGLGLNFGRHRCPRHANVDLHLQIIIFDFVTEYSVVSIEQDMNIGNITSFWLQYGVGLCLGHIWPRSCDLCAGLVNISTKLHQFLISSFSVISQTDGHWQLIQTYHTRTDVAKTILCLATSLAHWVKKTKIRICAGICIVWAIKLSRLRRPYRLTPCDGGQYDITAALSALIAILPISLMIIYWIMAADYRLD